MARLVFERGSPLEFAQIGIHIHQKIEFRNFRNIALDKYGCLLRIYPTGQIFSQNLPDIPKKVLRSWMGGEGVEIGNKEIGIVVMLHLDKILDRSEVISKVEVSCRSYSTDNCRHDGLMLKYFAAKIAKQIHQSVRKVQFFQPDYETTSKFSGSISGSPLNRSRIWATASVSFSQ